MLPTETQSGSVPNEGQDDASRHTSVGTFFFKPDRPKKEANPQALKALSTFAKNAQRNSASPVAPKPQASAQSAPLGAVPDQPVLVGEILGAQGVYGQIKVLPYAQQAQGESALVHAKRWRIVCKEDETQSRTVNVLKIRAHNRDTLVAEIQECTQREDAQALRGWKIYVDRAEFPKLKRGEYYWIDLIGLSAVNLMGVEFGRVVGLLESSAHAVLRIAPVIQASEATKDEALFLKKHKKQSTQDKATKRAAAEILIPFVKAYVGDICWTTRTIAIDWQGEEEA